MGPNDALRYIEFGAVVATGAFTAVTAAIAVKYRKEVLRAEKRKAYIKLQMMRKGVKYKV